PRLGAGVAPAQYFAHLLAATGGHGARRRAAAERREGGLDHVVRIGGANRLGDHVVNAERLEDGPHRPAGDDAGPGHGDAEHDAAGAIVPDHVMMQGAALAQRHADHAALGLLGRLADRLRYLAGLAGAVADPALAVADHHQGGEAEPPAALHDLGDAVDADELLNELDLVAGAIPVAIPVAVAAFFRASCHRLSSRIAGRPRGRRRPGPSPGHGTYRRRGRTRPP